MFVCPARYAVNKGKNSIVKKWAYIFDQPRTDHKIDFESDEYCEGYSCESNVCKEQRWQ